ncbi:MAG TPA: ABC transporter substrate-binding protein, partial [Clostridiaceae bacterium]|nr:ABC transporter substrate-binding protein [Clostridiaceae bacterium]
AFCLLSLALVLSGCSNHKQKNDAANAENGLKSRETMTLRVGQTGKGIKPAMQILANELGYMEEEGITLEWIQIQNLFDGTTALDQDKMDVLPMGIIPSLSSIASGSDFVIYGGTIAEACEAITTAEQAEYYQDLSFFEDKIIACMRPETGHLHMMALLDEANIKPRQWIELDGFQVCLEAVQKGTADVAFVNSGFGFRADQMGLVKIFDVGEYFPNNVCCRQTTSRKTFEEKREALIRLQMANLRAYHFAFGPDSESHQDIVVDALTDFSGLERDFVEYMIYSGVLKYELDPATDKVRDFYEIVTAFDTIPKTDVDLDLHLDYSIYQEALERLSERYPDESMYQELLDTIHRDNS